MSYIIKYIPKIYYVKILKNHIRWRQGVENNGAGNLPPAKRLKMILADANGVPQPWRLSSLAC